MNKSLNTLLQWMHIKATTNDIAINGFQLDSRTIKHGDAFIALAGDHHHGLHFAKQAQNNGAVVILSEPCDNTCDKAMAAIEVPVIFVDQLNEKISKVAAQFYDHPSKKLEIIGITGTNGKTSCAWLLCQAWRHMGTDGAYIGTLGYGRINDIHKLPNTTPPALILQHILAEFVDAGITHVAMEISSHGIALERTHGLHISGAALTNISRDHLDFHDSMEDYANTKKKLFTNFGATFAVLNHSNQQARSWAKHLSAKICRFGIDDEQADLNAVNVSLSLQGIHFTVNHNGNKHSLFTPLLARFNVENVLLVASVLLKQGHNWSSIIDVVKNFKPVPGRMNTLPQSDTNPLVIVDYAHTPDALEQVLTNIKQHQPNNMWCLFGCGGDRDPGKRPLMGAVAQQWAEHTIITDDNPRTEDNENIVADILKGMNTSLTRIIHDRKKAIAYAINNAEADDVIVIAGKGHENTQQIGNTYHPFDDRTVATELLHLRESCA